MEIKQRAWLPNVHYKVYQRQQKGGRRSGKKRKPKKQTGAGKKRKQTGKKSKSRKQTGDGLWSGLKEIFQ